MYIAEHYVKVNGKMIMKGESIQDNLPEGKIKWLLKAGAIKEVTPAFDLTEQQETPVAEAEPEQEAQIEEPETDTEAPQIDVMAGIVLEEPEEKPAKKPARKTERRKAK